MQERLTVDIDSHKYYYLILSLLEIMLYNNLKEFSVYKTKRGWHIIIWLKKPVSDRQHFRLRKKFGDDFNRLNMDQDKNKHGIPIQVLFNKKFYGR